MATSACPDKRKSTYIGAERKKKRKVGMTVIKSTEPIVVSSGEEVEDCREEEWVTIHGIRLSVADKKTILSGQWLNDKMIDAAQLLLKNDKDLLPVGSLQSPLLGQNLQFDVLGVESVQILHVGGAHWATISTVNTKNPAVRVYDSLYKSLPWSAKEQVATLVHTEKDAFILEYADVDVRLIFRLSSVVITNSCIFFHF